MTPAALLVAALLPGAPLAAGSSSLSAAAAASGRPPECSASSRRALLRGPSVWDRARAPTLQRYCDLVARAQAQLATSPEAAKKAAEEAELALPGRAAPQALLGRSLLALGMPGEAAAAFERARALEPRSLEEPAALHAYARVLLRTGKRDEALAAYRALVPRADLLGVAAERATVLLEAADASMAAAARDAQPGKRPHLEETIAYLREARQRAVSELAGNVGLLLALALDRAGDAAEADAALHEAERTGARLHPPALAFLAAPEDATALEALSREGSDRAGAQKSWEAFLAGPGGKGPWAAEARARLDIVRRGGGGARVRAPK